MEHELWFTALLNKLLAAPVSALLTEIARLHGLGWVRPSDLAHPMPNYVAMQVMVILVIVIGALALRPRLSVEHPGKVQHIMELVVVFIQDMADEIIGHQGRRYVAMIGTLGIFIVLCNLWGLVPTLSTPTAKIQVTLGCAAAAFLYYNFHGFREHGVVGYLRHLCGPMLAIAIIMLPIEVISNFGRMLSLSVRLQANMLVGDLLERVFGQTVPHALGPIIAAAAARVLHLVGLTLPQAVWPLPGTLMAILAPPLFGALHIFVSLLQAYIFMLLPAVYISLAVREEH